MGLVGDNVGVPIPVLDEVGRGGDVVEPDAGAEHVAERSVDADATTGDAA